MTPFLGSLSAASSIMTSSRKGKLFADNTVLVVKRLRICDVRIQKIDCETGTVSLRVNIGILHNFITNMRNLCKFL